MGPRGLHAVEAIAKVISDRKSEIDCRLLLFDDSGYLGCGPNYAPDQSRHNLLNIPCREVPLIERDELKGLLDIPWYPGYIEWQEEYSILDEYGADIYPARASIGCYLQARFQSWLTAWQKQFETTIVSRSVVSIQRDASSFSLRDSHEETYDSVAHVLLTVGHQPTERDEALRCWGLHTKDKKKLSLFEQPYPTQSLIDSTAIGAGDTVALRGLGLSMIDVVKGLTEGRSGRFEPLDKQGKKLRYLASAREPALMVPFSLDGLPMSPKPINEAFDIRFKPTEQELNLLISSLSPISRVTSGEQLKEIIVQDMATIAAGVYRRLAERRLAVFDSKATLIEVIKTWMNDESFSHPSIVPHGLSTRELLQRYYDMAVDLMPISVDFCAGQVWRHCQKTLYRLLNHAGSDKRLLVQHIKLDQRLKRYAFGPPVHSVARLLALCDADLLRFAVADDPSIRICNAGWQLSEDGHTFIATVMVNTVLDAPSVSQVSSPLIKELHTSGAWQVIDDDLGLVTDATGQFGHRSDVFDEATQSLVGRLAIGSVVEADSLSECFGPELDRWASAVVNVILDDQPA